jgi:hypothetical protein
LKEKRGEGKETDLYEARHGELDREGRLADSSVSKDGYPMQHCSLQVHRVGRTRQILAERERGKDPEGKPKWFEGMRRERTSSIAVASSVTVHSIVAGERLGERCEEDDWEESKLDPRRIVWA